MAEVHLTLDLKIKIRLIVLRTIAIRLTNIYVFHGFQLEQISPNRYDTYAFVRTNRNRSKQTYSFQIVYIQVVIIVFYHKDISLLQKVAS